MRALVTGARGFVGGSLLPALHESGIETASLSLRLESDAVFKLNSVFDVTSIERALTSFQPDAVVHLAGTIKAPTIKEHLELNFHYASSLLSAVSNYSHNVRVILIGSAAEYGLQQEASRLDESMACSPMNNYGFSKFSQTILADWHRHRGVENLVLRPFNLVGKYQDSAFVLGKVTRFLKSFVSGSHGSRETVLQLGPLDDTRDFVGVDALSNSILQALDLSRQFDPVINVCSGNPMKIRSVVDQAFSLVSSKVSYQEKIPQGYSAGSVVGNPQVFMENFGFRPTINWDEMLKELIFE